MSDLKEDLIERIERLKVFKTGSFTLASGAKSNFYIDGRVITLDPVGSELISKIIVNNLDKAVTAVGGPATAAIPIISSVILVSNILMVCIYHQSILNILHLWLHHHTFLYLQDHSTSFASSYKQFYLQTHS